MNPLSIDDLLKQCTVRLSVIGAGGHGTGFFVAPGLILTCAHVVKGAQSQQINVWWQNKNYTAVIESLPEDTEKVDLALLRLTLPDLNHPCLQLDKSVQLRDSLYSFGYTDEYSNGDPATFECEGLNGDEPPLLKFKAGQVRPGLSGSPLLNERTGKVCGIVKRSRDRSSDLGGRAVPTKVIFEQFPEVAEQQKRSCRTFPPNPFLPQEGRVENPQEFFGREREIQWIFEVLNSGSSVALIGEEGIGKSSLLWAIHQQAENRLQSSRHPVFIDLNVVDNEKEFYSTLCDAVGIPESRERMLFRNWKDRRVLLALDNVGKMTWKGFTRGVRDRLRGLAEGNNAPLKLVLAASASLDHLFKDSQDTVKTSPLAGICQEENIKPWNEPTARAFINARLAITDVCFPEEDITQLVQESGGHPQRLMRLCYRTYSRYVEGGE
jgi:hypothetical protein